METERGPRLLFRDASRELIPRPRIANNRRCSVSRPVTPRVQQRDCSRRALVSRATVSSPQVARRNNNISRELAIDCLFTLRFDNEPPVCSSIAASRGSLRAPVKNTINDGGSYHRIVACAIKDLTESRLPDVFAISRGKNVWMLAVDELRSWFNLLAGNVVWPIWEGEMGIEIACFANTRFKCYTLLIFVLTAFDFFISIDRIFRNKFQK